MDGATIVAEPHISGYMDDQSRGSVLASVSLGRLDKQEERRWARRVSKHDTHIFNQSEIYKATEQMIMKLGHDGIFGRNAVALMRKARNAALESDYIGPHLGCVIAAKGRIVGTGHNTEKTSPMQKTYNLRYRDFVEIGSTPVREHSLHAEMVAIGEAVKTLQAMSKRRRLVAYVYRVAPGLPYRQGLARPCGACRHALTDIGVSTIVYSTNDGFAVEYIQ